MSTVAALSLSHKRDPQGVFPAGAGNNGVSVDPVSLKLVLGNGIGSTAAQLLSDRYIQPNGFNLNFQAAAAGNLVQINSDGSLVLKNTLDEQYMLTHRGVSLGFPVPSLRPSTATQNIAFDIMPNGAAVDTTNGIAWMDICNVDCYRNNVVGIGAARVGVFSNRAVFGSKSFNGAAVLPVNFEVGALLVGELLANGSVQWNTASHTVIQSAVSSNTISFITNGNTGNSAALLIVGQATGTLKFGFLRFENDGVPAGNPANATAYQNPLQFEIVSNSAATNGITIAALAAGSPIRFFQRQVINPAFSVEVARFNSAQQFLVGTNAALTANDFVQVAGSLVARFDSGAANPTATEVPLGCWKLYKNTTTGILGVWANDGGVFKTVALV